METSKNIRNDLLKRNEISFFLESDKNPNFSEARKIIADEYKKNEEVIDVHRVKGSFGSNKFKINAYVYDNTEDLKKAKQLTQKQRAEIKKTAEEAKNAVEETEKIKVEEKAESNAEKPEA